VNFGLVEKVRDAMPEEVRNLWPLSSEALDIRERPEGYNAPEGNSGQERAALKPLKDFKGASHEDR